MMILHSHYKPKRFGSSVNLFPFCIFSSYGQSLTTSTFVGETAFAILIAILGLVLFAHLIGNMQVIRIFKSTKLYFQK